MLIERQLRVNCNPRYLAEVTEASLWLLCMHVLIITDLYLMYFILYKINLYGVIFYGNNCSNYLLLMADCSYTYVKIIRGGKLSRFVTKT